MPESVLVHLSPTRFTTGHYRVEGDTLIMTHDDGTPVDPPVSCVLKPTDSPKSIAAVLTKEIRSRMVNPFWDNMNHSENDVA